jgi:superfamily II DNA or RNA helicase
VNYAKSKRSPLIPRYLSAPNWKPRDYQSRMIADIEIEKNNGHRRILVSAPPGSGKTGMMAALARSAYLRAEKTTILVPFNCVVTKSATDLTQMCGALATQGLSGLFGVCSGAFPSLYNPNQPIQVVTLQSLSDELHLLLADTGLILIDEGHSAAFFAQAERAYKEWRWNHVINFTATPHNRSMGLDERHGDLTRNTAIVVGPPYRQLEAQGYLSPLRYHSIKRHIPKGEKPDLASEASIRQMLTEFKRECSILQIPTTHAIGYTKPKKDGESQAENIKRIGAELGLNFAIVGDGVSQDDYEKYMTEFDAGHTNLLCVQALTTGWDNALARHAIMFRQIGSRDRCVQAATRVDRVHSSKKFGEIWDYAYNFQLTGEDSGLHPIVEDLSETIDASVLQPKSKGCGEAPVKSCITCGETIHASLPICPLCGTNQPQKETYIDEFGKAWTLIAESTARASKDGAIAYFRQWRAIGYSHGWNPFAAHKKCNDLSIAVPMDSREFWMGSTGGNRLQYAQYLHARSLSWGWDAGKIERELKREFK